MSSHHKKPVVKEPVASKKLPSNAPMVFGKMNYILTAVSLLVLIIGFMLMSGKEGDIYDSKRTIVAPIVVVLGFCMGFVAIFYRDKKVDQPEQ